MIPSSARFRGNLRTANRWAVLSLFITTTAIGDETGRAAIPQDLPLEVQQVVARHQAHRDVLDTHGQLAVEEDTASTLRRLEAMQSEFDSHIEPWLRTYESEEDNSILRLGGAFVSNPYRNAAHAISAHMLERKLATIVPTRLSREERARFVRTFSRLDVRDLLSSTPADEDVEWLRTTFAAPLIGKFGRQALIELGKEVGKDLVSDYVSRLLRGDKEELILQHLQVLQSEVRAIHEANANDPRLDVIGGAVSMDLAATLETWAIAEHVDGQVTQLLELELQTAESVKTSLESIHEQQARLHTALQQVNSSVLTAQSISAGNRDLILENATRLQRIEKATFEHVLTPKEQLEWLEANALSLGEAEQAATLTRVKCAIIADEADSYLSTAQDIVSGLSALEFDEKVTRIANEGIRVGSAVNKAFRNAASGDILGAAIGLIGGLFGGGPDAAEARHQQVMENLAKIHELQVDTYNQVIEVRRDISRLAQQMQTNHKELLEHFNIVEKAIDDVRLELNDVLLMEYRTLREKLVVVGLNGVSSVGLDPLVDRLRRDETLRDYLLNQGADTLETVLGRQKGQHLSVLFLRAQAGQQGDDPTAMNRFLADVWQPHLDFALEESDWRSLWVLQHPKLELPLDDDLRLVSQPPWTESHFRELLSGARVAEVVETVLDVAPALWFIDRDSRSGQVMFVDYSSEATSTNRMGVARGKELYAMAIQLVDLAIAQQMLLQGGAIIPQLADDLHDPKVAQLLRANPVLRQNLALYLIKVRNSSAEEEGLSPFEYSTVIGFNDRWHLEKTLLRGRSAPPAIVRKAEGWVLELADECVAAMPSPMRYSAGRFHTTSEFDRLAYLRKRLAQATAGWEFKKKITPTDNRVLTQAMVARARISASTR